MLIQVKYPDNRYDYVHDSALDCLINSNTITGFERSTGWVRIDIDPIRKTKRGDAYIYPNDLRESLAAYAATLLNCKDISCG